MQNPKTSWSGILFAVAGAVAAMPPIPVFRDWNSQHIALLIVAVAGGAGLHFAADSKPQP